MFGKLLDTATYLKAKIKKDELELALVEATNQDNWQASSTTLHLISSSAYNHEKWQKIHQFLWDKLKNNKNWKKMLKAMNIVQFVLKNGPGFASDQMKYELRFFKTLANFDLYQDGIDRGASIRERAKSIVLLLQNDEILQDERLRAKQIREKMSHMSGSLNYSSQNRPTSHINKLESYSNKSFEKTKQDSGYYNYGSGNYGDRQTDQKYNHDYFQNINRFKKAAADPPKSTPTLPDNSVAIAKETPAQSKPSALMQSNVKNQNGNKTKFQSITQRLIKSSNKTQQKIIKPDLSYKKKNEDEQLIDTQANFVQTRYNFQEPKYTNSSNGRTQTSNTQEKSNNYQIQTPVPTVTTVQPNLLNNQLQGLNFLGIQTSPTTSTNKTSQIIPQSPPTVETPSQRNLTQLNVNSSAPVFQQKLNPITTSTTIPQPPSLPYNNNPSQTIYQNSQSLGLAYQQQNVYGQASVYGLSNPYYANPQYQAYNPYGYATNPYSNGYNPYSAYQQPNSYQSGAYLPQNQVYSYIPATTQPLSNPYANLSNISISMSPDTSILKKQQPKTNSNSISSPSKSSNSLAQTDFKIQNINWLSGNQKSLTDLSDLALQIQPSKKTEVKPKVEGNQVKIDPWAW